MTSTCGSLCYHSCRTPKAPGSRSAKWTAVFEKFAAHFNIISHCRSLARFWLLAVAKTAEAGPQQGFPLKLEGKCCVLDAAACLVWSQPKTQHGELNEIMSVLEFNTSIRVRTSTLNLNNCKEQRFLDWFGVSDTVWCCSLFDIVLRACVSHLPWTSQVDRIPLSWVQSAMLAFFHLVQHSSPLDSEYSPPLPSSLCLAFRCRKPDGAVACQAFHLAPLATPDASPSVRAQAWTPFSLRHAMSLVLFPALAAPQDVTAGHSSCQ